MTFLLKEYKIIILNIWKKIVLMILGKKILLKANKGRKQVVTKKGILEKVYPSVFVVKLDSDNEGCSRVSYSYSDLLTSNVKLQVFRNQDKLHVS